MKIKRKISTLALAGIITFGGTVSAASGYFVSQINDHKASEQERLDDVYQERLSTYQHGVNLDLQKFTESEMDRITKEVTEYANTVAAESAMADGNATREQIKNAADEAIAELKNYIDSLAE